MAEDGKSESRPDAAPLPPIAGKAKDLEALRNAVVDAANVSAGLWFSYLFVLLYLVITVGSVTHRNLLFESPVKLPFLGVELPLLGFFILGPAIFLIVHAYVLLHFAMLADKVGVFHAELLAQKGYAVVLTARPALASSVWSSVATRGTHPPHPVPARVHVLISATVVRPLFDESRYG